MTDRITARTAALSPARSARSLIGLGVTIAVGYAVGFRPAAGPGGWAAAVAVILLATFALSWIAALIGLGSRSVEAAQQLGALVVIPVFVSSALVPAATMPPWLRVITANQPVTRAIDTAPPGDEPATSWT